MNVKNTTPFIFGPKVTSRRPPQPEMTLVLRGAFVIQQSQPVAIHPDQGALSAEIFHPDDEERRGECLYPGDFADFKLNAEVMLRGTCHPPGRGPYLECPVRFAVGAWSKTLRVVGTRAWSDRLPGAVPSEPRAFTRMSLDYTQSFGGPGYPTNPVGKGFETDLCPCIERPGEPLRARRDRPEPASFGPINPAWPQRAAKIGKEYGRSYREKRAPYYAEDFDWTHFHAAQADQQIKGYLRGDEEVTFQHLHPEAPLLVTRLPGLRIRAFVKDARARFREVTMHLDTLFADLDEGTLYLTWRGIDAVAEDDLSDVSVVRIASEPMTGEKLPLDHYRAEVDAFEKDPQGFRAALPPGMAELAEEHGDEADVGPGARLPYLVDSFLASLKGKTTGEIDAMAAGTAGAAGSTDALRAILLKASSGQGGGPAPPLFPAKPGALPVVKVGPSLRTMQANAEQIKKQAEGRGQAVTGLESIDALANDPRLKLIDPTFKPPRPVSMGGDPPYPPAQPADPPPEEPGPRRTLAGLDLTGRDLSGLDLTGANLEGAILTRAKLRGTILAGANLKYAVLYEADLAGADLTDADLTLVQAARAKAMGATLRGATVEQASFEKADLTDAILEGSKGEYVRFSKANLSRAKAVGCSLASSHFDSARLEQADFSEAVLSHCLFLDARARGVIMTRAALTGSSLEGADFRAAKLVGVKGDATAWMRAKLDDADLRHAWMTGAIFMEVSANRAIFLEANLKEGRFYRAAIDGASFVRANLFAADFGKAKMSGTSFAGANLYDAKFLGAAGKGCDFEGANLKRSTLENQT